MAGNSLSNISQCQVWLKWRMVLGYEQNQKLARDWPFFFVPSTSSANSARSSHFWVVQIYFLRGHSNTCFPKMVIWYVQFRWMTYYKFAAGRINACIERLQWERLGKLESAFWWCNCLDNWTSEQFSLQFVIFDCYNFYWPVSTEIDTTTPWKRNTHLQSHVSWLHAFLGRCPLACKPTW